MRNRAFVSCLIAILLAFGLCSAASVAKDTPFYVHSDTELNRALIYDAANDVVKLNYSDSRVLYTVGENTNGIFDIYLQVAKRAMTFGSTPLSISINDGPASVPIIEYGTATWSRRGWLDLYDKGVFLCLENTALKAGDKITITLLPGFVAQGFSYAPYISDIILYRPGEKVAVGYGGTFSEKKPANPSDPLSGLQLVWLGSSVTYGLMAKGYSMADYLEEQHSRLRSYKYAVSGTMLTDAARNAPDPTSYVSRMKQIPAGIRPDFFIVQLSTNDATSIPPKPIGKFVDSSDLNEFDTSTVYGAIQYIIVYAMQTWNCPVVFYTGIKNQYPAYDSMREALLDIRNRWGIEIIDLYSILSTADPDITKYMSSDALHPKADGYRLWWGPVFEKILTEFVTAEK